MARTKADIEKDWTKAETALTASIAQCKKPQDFEVLEANLTKLTTAWGLWNKYLAEADKKISEKDWKDDKKLDADRKKFKAWVISQRDKEHGKFEKEIFDIQKAFAVRVKANRDAENQLKEQKARIMKALTDYKADNDPAAAIATLEDVTEEVGRIQSINSLKASVFEEGKKLLKGVQAAMPKLEKDQKEQLKIEGDVNKLTYDDIRKNMKLFKAFCQMLKQPDHAKFFEVTNYGKKGSEDAYRRFIKTNTVNVPATLVGEFDVVANAPAPEWSSAPWLKVVQHIDVMLGHDARHLATFKQKLVEAKMA